MCIEGNPQHQGNPHDITVRETPLIQLLALGSFSSFIFHFRMDKHIHKVLKMITFCVVALFIHVSLLGVDWELPNPFPQASVSTKGHGGPCCLVFLSY